MSCSKTKVTWSQHFLQNAGLGLFLLLLVFPAQAQDALRYSQAGEAAAKVRAQAIEHQDYNLRLGNASFLATGSLDVELNDNVALSSSGYSSLYGRALQSEEDIILRPHIDTRVFWPITQKNSLNFSLGVGYAKYIRNTDFDYLTIAPGSELSFDLFVKDFRFTFFDRFAYTQDPLENGAVSGVANYGGLNNSVGANVLWDLNKALLTFGYAHQNFIPDQSEFEYLTRESELIFTRAAFLLTPYLTVGPEVTGTLTAYDTSTNFLNDSFSYSAGAFAEARLSTHLQLGASAGIVSYEFDSQGQTRASENPLGYYLRLRAAHVLNEYISHSLSGGRETTLGVYSDAQERYFAQYGINWRIIKGLAFSTDFLYEHGNYSANQLLAPAAVPINFLGETYDRFGFTLGLGFRLMEKLTTTLAYRRYMKTSNNELLDYTQNAVTIGVTYRF